MPRRGRKVVPGLAHHVTQRGNYRQLVFEDTRDFQKYSYWMREYSQKYGVEIVAYCLMGNHVHFIVKPRDVQGLARLFNTVHMRYSQYKNAEKQQSGHLWQGRFYSCILSDEHLYQAIRYVEQNPVRARMVARPWDYPWSSARQHVKKERSPIIPTTGVQCLGEENHEINWKNYLEEHDGEMWNLLRKSTQKGLAVGPNKFILWLERKLGCTMQERRAGRPRKDEKK